jgi:acyl carrier protein
VTRDQILSTVKTYLVDAVDDLDPDLIDPARSMKDLGANSLDIVEVVSRTMRELKIKVPRAELSKLENIDGLVDLLHEVSLRQAEAVG